LLRYARFRGYARDSVDRNRTGLGKLEFTPIGSSRLVEDGVSEKTGNEGETQDETCDPLGRDDVALGVGGRLTTAEATAASDPYGMTNKTTRNRKRQATGRKRQQRQGRDWRQRASRGRDGRQVEHDSRGWPEGRAIRDPGAMGAEAWPRLPGVG